MYFFSPQDAMSEYTKLKNFKKVNICTQIFLITIAVNFFKQWLMFP